MATSEANEGVISARSSSPTYLRPTPPFAATRSC